jgi:hypothetical protein
MHDPFIKNLKTKLTTVFLINLMAFNVVGQLKLFVAVSGNDTAKGSIKQPFQSIEKALLTAQKSPQKKIIMYLRAGTYYIDSTIVINTISAENKEIIISGYKKEHVTISAEKKYEIKWKAYDKNIYVATLDLPFEPDAMFICGTPSVMARYPNYDANARVFNGVASDAISDDRIMQENGAVFITK